MVLLAATDAVAIRTAKPMGDVRPTAATVELRAAQQRLAWAAAKGEPSRNRVTYIRDPANQRWSSWFGTSLTGLETAVSVSAP
jgi:hypothetical protein